MSGIHSYFYYIHEFKTTTADLMWIQLIKYRSIPLVTGPKGPGDRSPGARAPQKYKNKKINKI